MTNKLCFLFFIISLIFLIGCNGKSDLNENVVSENIVNETSEEIIELQNQDINAVLQGFKTVFGRDLKINLELETEEYRVYSDPSIQVLEIKDKDDYIATYGDLFKFVKSEADLVLVDFKGEDKSTSENEYPQYVYRYILENEGKVNHIFIKRHVLWAELDRSSFQDHEYYQWTYDYCSPNIVVKILAKRNFGGMETYSSYESFMSNAESHGEEYTGGLKEGTTLKRPPLIQNFDSLRKSESCFKIPSGFNNDFENLREDITEEIGVSGFKSPQITEEEIDDFQENSFEGACPPPTQECDQTWWLKTRKEEIDGKEYYVYHCDYFVGDIGKIYEKNRYCLENHEICNDWKDNDQNGLMDCADPNCSNDIYCA